MTFRVEETKTGEPLELPVTRQLVAILQNRFAECERFPERSRGWVFPSGTAESGHINSGRQYLNAWISEAGGARFWFQCARLTGASAAGESPAGKKGKPPLPPRVMGCRP